MGVEPCKRNTGVTLGAHYEKFIAQQVAQGHFGTVSEAIRAGLRLLEEREIKLAAFCYPLKKPCYVLRNS